MAVCLHSMAVFWAYLWHYVVVYCRRFSRRMSPYSNRCHHTATDYLHLEQLQVSSVFLYLCDRVGAEGADYVLIGRPLYGIQGWVCIALLWAFFLNLWCLWPFIMDSRRWEPSKKKPAVEQSRASSYSMPFARGATRAAAPIGFVSILEVAAAIDASSNNRIPSRYFPLHLSSVSCTIVERVKRSA